MCRNPLSRSEESLWRPFWRRIGAVPEDLMSGWKHGHLKRCEQPKPQVREAIPELAMTIRQAVASIPWLDDGDFNIARGLHGYTIRALQIMVSRLLQSFAPATHAKPSQLSAGNGPRGLWAGLCAESRNRGTEEKGQLPQRPLAVDTPLSVDCGSYVFPFPGRIPNIVRRLSDSATSSHPMLLYI